jgi:hypothetical protein
MDPITALSIAGNVVQFISFGSDLFSKGREIYKSTTGTLSTYEQLELLTTDLRSLVIKSFANELIRAHLSNLYPITGMIMSSRRRSRISATMLQSLAKLAFLRAQCCWELLRRTRSGFSAQTNRIWLSVRYSIVT